MCAIFAAVTAVCSWIALPFTVPFTLQTFSVFLCLLLLGGRYGLISIVLYVALGAVGLPVFAGFNSGFSALSGPTGGYIWGFIASAGAYWLITKIFGEGNKVRIAACACGLLLCYLLGTLWFAYGYAGGGSKSFLAVLALCVLPYIIPDILKIAAAFALSARLSKLIYKN